MNEKIILELSLREAKILTKMIQSHNPPIENEIIVIFLYNRILKLIEAHET